MPQQKRVGLREVRALQPGGIVWDSAVPGFGARRQRDAITYMLKYRTSGGRQRWHTIGRHGAPWTPDMAREEARRLLGEVVKGVDPAAEKSAARHAVTVAELCRRYFADADAGRLLVRGGRAKKPGTLLCDRGRIDAHIIPLLGHLSVTAVTRQDVEGFMHAIAAGETARQSKTKPRGLSRVRGGRAVAARTVGLLGAIFAYAIHHHMRADNPAHGVRKFADNKRDRRLSDEEYETLGDGLRRAEGTIWPAAIACARFLVLTGWRTGEALALQWRDLDLNRRTALLPDTKTGRSIRPLSSSVCAVLRSTPRLGDNALVFPATRGNGPMVGFKKFARRIVAMAGLTADVTPHVWRHSFASLAADLGYSEPTIAALVGHKGHTTTSRYIHSADAVLLAAADAVSGRTAQLLGDGETQVIIARKERQCAGPLLRQ
jgi:integrase